MIPWFHQQLVHVRNGCISDHPTHLPYVKVGKTNFHNTGHHLDHYQSLRSQDLVLVDGREDAANLEQENSVLGSETDTWEVHARESLFSGTSKQGGAVHSVLDRTFNGTHGLCTEVFDARLGWRLLGYNRRRLRALGKNWSHSSVIMLQRKASTEMEQSSYCYISY